MRSFRIGRWGYQNLYPCARPCCPLGPVRQFYNIRLASTASAAAEDNEAPVKKKRGRPRKQPLQEMTSSMTSPSLSSNPEPIPDLPSSNPPVPSIPPTEILPSPLETEEEVDEYRYLPPPSSKQSLLESLPSPHPSAARSSAKLAALHARLRLSPRIPLETLARTLVHKSADRDARFNNSGLAQFGNDLLGYYMAEHILCHYPRLPLAVLHAVEMAYVGPRTCARMAQEWGVEPAADPGGEVDPGYLQFLRTEPTKWKEQPANNHFQSGSAIAKDASEGDAKDHKYRIRPAPLETAAAAFTRAVFAAIYLHTGAESPHAFFKDHVLSRHLDISTLFTFKNPIRDLALLCSREGFEAPVARILSETGRHSIAPVFVVGIFSGRDILGQAAGNSLIEARTRAAIKALKGWYLYSPKPTKGEIMVPSMMEGEKGRDRNWTPAHIDIGEVVQ